jgi:hypothetical protein
MDHEHFNSLTHIFLFAQTSSKIMIFGFRAFQPFYKCWIVSSGYLELIQRVELLVVHLFHVLPLFGWIWADCDLETKLLNLWTCESKTRQTS